MLHRASTQKDLGMYWKVDKDFQTVIRNCGFKPEVISYFNICVFALSIEQYCNQKTLSCVLDTWWTQKFWSQMLKSKSWESTGYKNGAYEGALFTRHDLDHVLMLPDTSTPETYSGGQSTVVCTLNIEYVSSFSLTFLEWPIVILSFFYEILNSLTKCSLLSFLFRDCKTFPNTC